MRLPFAVSCAILAIRVASADTTSVSVGGISIALPAPAGFFRYDGKSAEVDALNQQFVAPMNRLLASFGTEETLAEVLADRPTPTGPEFDVQTLRSAESSSITAAAFNKAKSEVRYAVTLQTEKYRKLIKAMETQANAVIAPGSMTLNESISLGIFDESDDSICFAMLLKIQSGSDSYVSVVASALIRVNNRVLYLNAYTPYRQKSDIDWARTGLQDWRDAVLSANR